MRTVSMDTRERIAVRKWVQEAIALYESAGGEAVLAEIANPGGRFVQGDRCIFALDINGTMLANPVESESTGKVLIDLKDSDGKAFIRKIVDISSSRGYGFVEYKWHHPVSKKELHKTVFFEKVDGMIFCCGFYRLEEEFL